MLFRILLTALLTSGVASCASPQGKAPAYPPEAFAHRIATSEVVLYWNCDRPEAGVLRLDGVAHNPWMAQPIRFLELELVGVDARDRTLSSVTGAARDIQIFTNQITSFRLDLKTTGGEARFDLFYQYRFLEGEQKDARLAGPPMASPDLFAQTNRFLLRDACAEGKHRAR